MASLHNLDKPLPCSMPAGLTERGGYLFDLLDDAHLSTPRSSQYQRNYYKIPDMLFLYYTININKVAASSEDPRTPYTSYGPAFSPLGLTPQLLRFKQARRRQVSVVCHDRYDQRPLHLLLLNEHYYRVLSIPPLRTQSTRFRTVLLP